MSSAGSGPLTIHVTLPEHLQGGQGIAQQLHLVPAQRTNAANGGQYVLTQDQYGNQAPLHVIQIQVIYYSGIESLRIFDFSNYRYRS